METLVDTELVLTEPFYEMWKWPMKSLRATLSRVVDGRCLAGQVGSQAGVELPPNTVRGSALSPPAAQSYLCTLRWFPNLNLYPHLLAGALAQDKPHHSSTLSWMTSLQSASFQVALLVRACEEKGRGCCADRLVFFI